METFPSCIQKNENEGSVLKNILHWHFNSPVAPSHILSVSSDLSPFVSSLGSPLEENAEDTESLQSKIRKTFCNSKNNIKGGKVLVRRDIKHTVLVIDVAENTPVVLA